VIKFLMSLGKGLGKRTPSPVSSLEPYTSFVTSAGHDHAKHMIEFRQLVVQ
jgi:hypothetical protein